jgi:hypothetical protein
MSDTHGVEEPKPIEEWLETALGPIREEIEETDNEQVLVYVGSRLTEIEQTISDSFDEVRKILAERLSQVTGRVKGQG